MAGEGRSVAVALCSRLDRADGGLDSGKLARRLELSSPDVHVEVVPDLCSHPQRAAAVIARSGARRLVCALSGHEAQAEDFQGWIRRAGLDPHALSVVNLRCCAGQNGSAPLTDNAVLLVEAAIARMRAFQGSEPEQVKPRLLTEGRSLSRRSLVALPPWTYDALPLIDPDRCPGKQRCGLCVSACPAAAIRVGSGGSLAVDTDRCEGCGRCVTACPPGAIDWPAASTAQCEAQLEVLCGAPAPRLLFACKSRIAALQGSAGGAALHGWLPVELPCVGMVTAGWILQALVTGAETVGLLACGEDCRFDREEATRQRVSYVHEVLRLSGEGRPEERVVLARGDPQQVSDALAAIAAAGNADPPASVRDGERRHAVTLTEPEASAGAVLALAPDREASPEDVVAHDASPLGLVRVREETCTTCGACAAACPTGALALVVGDESMELSFDAARCVGCLRCADVCPEAAEGTLRASRVTDPGALRRGPTTLASGPSVRCRHCGGPVAPAAMLERMESLLEDDDESGTLLETLTEVCTKCR